VGFFDEDYDDNPMRYSEILPRLWQGGTGDEDMISSSKVFSSVTDRHPFTAVVTLDALAQPVIPGVKEYRYGFLDTAIEKSQVPNILAAADWAYEQWVAKETVVIRCHAGANRSGLVMALVLMKDGKSADQAIELIRSKRASALSNSAFVKWLREI